MQRDPGQSPGGLGRIGVTEHGQVTCRRHRLTGRARPALLWESRRTEYSHIILIYII
jgi:hypothetical protein